MLEGVVGKDGTAPEAEIPGYRVAGKTGTADRYDDKTGRYCGYTASFIGYRAGRQARSSSSASPCSDRSRATSVACVAGPVFHDVMTYALQELKIPPTGATTPPTIKLKTADAVTSSSVRDGPATPISAHDQPPRGRPRAPASPPLRAAGGPSVGVRHRRDPRLAGGPAR